MADIDLRKQIDVGSLLVVGVGGGNASRFSDKL
jgi:hypothetical protein